MANQICSPIRRKVYIREEIEDLTTAKKLVNNIVLHQNYTPFGGVQSSLSNTTWIQTPMEVDDCSDHLDEEKCESNERNQNNFPAIDKYYKNKMSQGKTAKVYTRRAVVLGGGTFTNVLWSLIFCLIILLCYFMVIGVPFVSVTKEFDLEGLRLELQKKVLGQHTAVADIVHNFERVDSWMQKIKIMPFVGSNGVGKTFTANMLIKYFDRSAVFSIEGSSFLNLNVQNTVLETISDSYFNLIIIDELHSSQLGSLFKFVKQIPKFDRKTIVVPIFNIQDRSSFDKTFKIDGEAFQNIRNELDRSGFYFEVILFHTLDNSTLKNYVKSELVRRNIDTSKHARVIDSFIQDKNIEYTGLKGISFRLSKFLDKMFSSNH